MQTKVSIDGGPPIDATEWRLSVAKEGQTNLTSITPPAEYREAVEHASEVLSWDGDTFFPRPALRWIGPFTPMREPYAMAFRPTKVEEVTSLTP
jgi:hypothetical protein